MVSEVLVIGGGLAGGAAALRLAHAGLRVRVLERETGPHDKVCGEFLSIEAQRDLLALGINPAWLGGVTIDRVRLVARGREFEARLPFEAMGLSRRVLDEVLLEAAADAGAAIERGVRVSGIDQGVVRTSAGPRVGQSVLLATGKHDLRGLSRRAASRRRDDYVGFKMHWRIPACKAHRFTGLIELLVFAGGYAGLQLVAPTIANMCLIVRRDRFAVLGGSWDGLLAELLRDPAFAARLGEAEPLGGRPQSIANLPYGFIFSGEDGGLFRLGDQAAMTGSLSGDGMAAALHSARLVAECIIAGGGAGDHHARLRASTTRQVRRAMLLQHATQSPLAMRLGMAAFRARPDLLGTIAGATRLPDWRGRTPS